MMVCTSGKGSDLGTDNSPLSVITVKGLKYIIIKN